MSPRPCLRMLALAALMLVLPAGGGRCPAAPGPADVAIRFAKGKVTGSDAGGPRIGGGLLGDTKAFLKLDGLTGIQGALRKEPWPAGKPWWQVTLSIEGHLALDPAHSRFPLPPAQQTQRYAGKLRLRCVQLVVDPASGRTRQLTEGTAVITGATSMTYLLAPGAGMAATMDGQITGGTNPMGLGKHVSGAFTSRVPLRYKDPSEYEVAGMRLTFSAQPRR